MLQATIIPTVQEDKLFYRQRTKQVIEANKEFANQYVNEVDNTVAHIGDVDSNDID